MAEEEQKEEPKKAKRTREPRSWSSTKVLDCVAYFAVMCIAVALVLRLIFKGKNLNIEQAFASVGECLAYIICIWLAFYWTMRTRGSGWNKRNMWWLICWLVATVVIIVIYVFAII